MGILTYFCLGPLGGILAIVFGFVGLRKAKEVGTGRGMSIAGIVLGAVGIVAEVILVVVLVAAGSKAANDLSHVGGPADASSYQLSPGSCTTDSAGFTTFRGTIQNKTSTTKNFFVDGEFRDSSTNAVVDTSRDLVGGIAPGDTAAWKIVTSATDAGQNVTCKVTSVDNFLN